MSLLRRWLDQLRNIGKRPLLCAAVVLGSLPAQAAANSTSGETAQLLFEEALSLLDQNRPAEACPKLEQSLALDPGIGTKFQLADCYERLGKRATAYRLFDEVAEHCARISAIDHERIAKARKASVEEKLQYLVLQVESPVAGLQLYIDGIELLPEAWKTRLPVDPGDHRFEARANAYATLSGNVAVAPENRVTVLTIGTLQQTLQKTGSSVGTVSAPTGRVNIPSIDKTTTRYRTLGIISVSAGAASLAAGGLFGLLAISKQHESDAECDSRTCSTTSATALHNDAVVAGNRSTALLAIGGVLTAASVGLLIALPSQSNSSMHTAVQLQPEGTSIQLGGRF